MMCAAHAGKGVLVIDHASNPGEKIRISGGGRCNFTNLHTGPENFLSENPHFAKSALARYTQWDFIDLLNRHGIPWHEKTLGQLFCDGSARQVVQMLCDEMTCAGAGLWLQTSLIDLKQTPDGFTLRLKRNGTEKTQTLTCRNLVLASGGKSIPKMGATGLAHDIARQFDIPVTETRAALVPFTFAKGKFTALAGVSLPVRLSNARASFDEALLFTHRGLSGPSVLQLSSYWRQGEAITIDLTPDQPLYQALRQARQANGRRQLSTELARHLPLRLVDYLNKDLSLTDRLGDQSDARLQALSDTLANWQLTPSGTEGYRTAEVTAGGIDTSALSSTTMECKTIRGLYFIGEAVDVTGWLGGFNFQWAWSSGHAAGTAMAQQAR